MLKMRREFSAVYDPNIRHLTVAAGRGTGKTFAAIDSTIMFLLALDKPNASAVFLSKTLKQAKATVFPALQAITADYPKGFYKANMTNGIFDFRISNKDIRRLYLGSYQADDNTRGYHPEIIVMDEVADLPYDLFDSVIYPMLNPAIAAGWWRLTAIGTVKGDQNKFYEFYLRGLDENFTNWNSLVVKASQSSAYKPEQLEMIKQNLGIAEFEQEYECNWHSNVIVGSIFGNFYRQFAEKKLQANMCWDPSYPVYTSWDLGLTDSTAIWFFQVKGDTVIFIDYLEDSGQLVPFYADQLLKKPYTYALCIVPFDGLRGDMRGEPISTQLEHFGFRVARTPACPSKTTQIHAARELLQRCYFQPDTTELGRSRLVNYKYVIDPKTGLPRQNRNGNMVDHDENSHGADAFCYAAISESLWKSPIITTTMASQPNYYHLQSYSEPTWSGV